MASTHGLLGIPSAVDPVACSPRRCFSTAKLHVTLATSFSRPPNVQTKHRAGSLCSKCSHVDHQPVLISMNRICNVSCRTSMADGHSAEPEESYLERLVDKAKFYWNQLPEPVKSFPWNTVLENFVQLILDLAWTVIKCLSVPLLAITSLGEMSYCARERKLVLVPFPLVIGFTLAGILKETAVELSPRLKDAEVPWHLLAIAIFFTLLKLPGPYYPHWGRLFIPHFANGGILRTLYLAYLWYRRPNKTEDAASVLKHGEDYKAASSSC